MEPFVALVLTTAVLRATGARYGPFDNVPTCLRGGLAVMFTMTGISHYVGMRHELIRMVPPSVPAPELMVDATGAVELAGAAALLRARTAPWAALGLSGLLVGMFPANIHWAVSGQARSRADQLLPRTALQIAFLAATLTVGGPAIRDVASAIVSRGRPSHRRRFTA